MVLSKNIIDLEQCYPDPLLSNSSSFPRIIFHLKTEDGEKKLQLPNSLLTRDHSRELRTKERREVSTTLARWTATKSTRGSIRTQATNEGEKKPRWFGGQARSLVPFVQNRMKVCRVARRLGQGGEEARGRMSLVGSTGVGEGRVIFMATAPDVQ